MSVRNVFKVTMSLLLAMTLAATATRVARVDLSLASVAAGGKLNDKIPYLLCIRICTGTCLCDKRPIDIAQCTCTRPGDSVNSNKPAALLHASGEALQVKGESEHSGPIPYTECMKTCSKCACTLMWPPESNICLCLEGDSVPKKEAAVADRLDHSLASVIGGDDKKMVLWTTTKMEATIPYKECLKTCKLCACTLIWPPEASTCICIPPKPQVALQVKGESEHSGPIPYAECMKICSKCACTMMWPPESNMCLCFEDDSVPKKEAVVADRLDHSLASVIEKANELYEKLDLLAGPIPKGTGGDDKKMVLWTTTKMEATISYKECAKTCEYCACTPIWPPEAVICVCLDPKPQVAGGKAVAK